MAIAESAANLQFALLLASFAALTHVFVTSDFSVNLVVLNSHSLKPMLYKITGVWGNHEGSMLLWILVLALFNYFIFKLLNKERRERSKSVNINVVLIRLLQDTP